MAPMLIRVKGKKKAKVGGCCKTTKTAYEFKGCWWHVHDCVDFTGHEGTRDPQRGTTAAEVEEQDHQRKTSIKKQGIQVVEITECDWKRQEERNPEIKTFLKS